MKSPRPQVVWIAALSAICIVVLTSWWIRHNFSDQLKEIVGLVPAQKVDPIAFKESVTEQIAAGNYQDAIDFVNACGMIHMATVEYQNKGEACQFLCVMEDGADLPGLDVHALALKDLIEFSQSAWCFPGTSDAQIPGDQTNWQHVAHEAARQYNAHLYQLRGPNRVK